MILSYFFLLYHLQNYIDLNYPFELEEESVTEPQFTTEEKELLPEVTELELPQSTSSSASNECGVCPEDEEESAEEAEEANEDEAEGTVPQIQEDIIIEAEEAQEEAEEIEDTRPVCASLDGRRTKHLRRPGELSVPQAHCIVPIMENCQLRTDRQSVESLEKDPSSSDRESIRSRGNSKSDSVSTDSSSGFRSGGYQSEDEPPPEYSKVVTVHYNGDEVV